MHTYTVRGRTFDNKEFSFEVIANNQIEAVRIVKEQLDDVPSYTVTIPHHNERPKLDVCVHTP